MTHSASNNISFRTLLRSGEFILFDGAMGTMLQKSGMKAGDVPELLSVTHPEIITGIHRAYVKEGSDVVTTNTFGANRLKLEGKLDVNKAYEASIRCAQMSGARYVAADIGPLGTLLEPLGTLAFEDAYGLFKEQVVAATSHGADLILIETMSDLLEIKAAVLAAKENSDLPIVATMSFDETGKTFLGTTPSIAARVLDALAVDAVGINCSLEPQLIAPFAKEMLRVTDLPVIVQANAGIPLVRDGETMYSVDAKSYASSIKPLIEAGLTLVGGCCGTDPSYIACLKSMLVSETPVSRLVKPRGCVTSAQNEVVFDGSSVSLVGECINPTGRLDLKKAIQKRDFDFIARKALQQSEAQAQILDVNMGVPGENEEEILPLAIKRIQSVCSTPLQVDSANPSAIEASIRSYAGKPMINSVNAKKKSLDTIIPLAAHYGCALIGLTLNEDGIPSSAQDRLALARIIVEKCLQYGIPRQDIFIDCLVLTTSTNQKEARETLRAIRLVKEELGVNTILGISNVSFGLPAPEVLNAHFLSAAFSVGLDAAIANPFSKDIQASFYAWRVVANLDIHCVEWIERYGKTVSENEVISETGLSRNSLHDKVSVDENSDDPNGLDVVQQRAYEGIVQGLKGEVSDSVSVLCKKQDAQWVIDTIILPALDKVGKLYDEGSYYLVQLMASAEAAKEGFDIISAQFSENAKQEVTSRGSIVLATVQDDIHDIGKNIVKMLLENYGFDVVDLGYDVAPETVLEVVSRTGIKLVGLSSLMTTTLPSMEQTVALLREKMQDVSIIVGGAVVSKEYAHTIGADFYAADASAAVHIVEKFYTNSLR